MTLHLDQFALVLIFDWILSERALINRGHLLPARVRAMCSTARSLLRACARNPPAGDEDPIVKVNNPLLMAVTAVVGLIAFHPLQPTWVMVK